MAYKSKEDQRERNRRYYQENKDTIKANVRRYQQENKEKRAAAGKAWRTENKEKKKAMDAKHYLENRKAIRKQANAYTATHGEENRARAAKWYKENPERGKANAKVANHKRRARIAEVGGTLTKADIRDLYASQGARCYYCSINIEEGYEIEHMTPISRGGTNGPENICLACTPCNRTKHCQTAEEFMHVGE